MGSYAGIELDRQRSVVVVLNGVWRPGVWSRFDNTPANWLGRSPPPGGVEVEVAMEGCWGWYWAADVIGDCVPGCTWPIRRTSRATPTGGSRTTSVTPLCWLICCGWGRLPEAWLAPSAVRELREEVRYRHQLTRLRTA